MHSIFTQRKCNPNCRKRGASRGQILYAEDERDARSQCSFIPQISHLDQWQMESYLLLITGICSREFGGFVSACMDVGATCTHPRGLSTGPESTPPAIQWLAPEVTLFDSSHNPLGKKGVLLTGRMCQATVAAPPTALNPHNPKPPPTGLTKWLVGD